MTDKIKYYQDQLEKLLEQKMWIETKLMVYPRSKNYLQQLDRVEEWIENTKYLINK